MNEKLFLTWQDSETRRWFPIGELVRSPNEFRFRYLYGAIVAQDHSGFRPLISFPNLHSEYVSDRLFPVFMNRVLPSSRPEYGEIVSYLGTTGKTDAFGFLARTGGAKATDSFQIFAAPRLRNNVYTLNFFVHGLRYMPLSSIDRIKNLKQREKLYLMHDFQNPVDLKALLIRTEDNHNVGFCPSYLLEDLSGWIGKSNKLSLKVRRVNNGNSPLQFRLLVDLGFPSDASRKPFSDGNFARLSASLNVREIYSEFVS